jgi:hypothetical protein
VREQGGGAQFHRRSQLARATDAGLVHLTTADINRAFVERQAAAARAQKPIVFTQATETHFEAHAPGWKHRRARRCGSNPIVRYPYPIVGRLCVNDIIMAEHIAAVLRAATNTNAPEAGRRIRARIEAVLDAAIAKKVHPLKRKKAPTALPPH